MWYSVIHNILLRAPVPYILQMEPTQRCHCRCPFCYHPAEAGSGDMTPQQVTRTLEEAYRAGCRYLVISGGEPFLYSHLQYTTLTARKTGYTVSVFTNGAFDENAFRQTFMYIDRLTISIDFPDRRHDQWRGFAGLYQRCVNAVRRAQEARIDVRIAATLWRENAGCVEDLVVLAKTLGAPIYFRLMTREHPGLNIDFLDSDEERATVADEILSLKKSNPGVVLNPTASLKLLKSGKTFKCRICTLVMNVDDRGRVYSPCPAHEGNKFPIMGNIFTQPVEQIWFSHAARDFRRATHDCTPGPDCYSSRILDPALLLAPNPKFVLEQIRARDTLGAFFRERGAAE